MLYAWPQSRTDRLCIQIPNSRATDLILAHIRVSACSLPTVHHGNGGKGGRVSQEGNQGPPF